MIRKILCGVLVGEGRKTRNQSEPHGLNIAKILTMAWASAL